MSDKYDAIIIGAGIIGTCVAFELCKKGYKTLNIDKNPTVGYGSTSSSLAVLRSYYSTTHASALAYEGWHIWQNWSDYVGNNIDSELVKYHATGSLLYKTAGNNQLAHLPAIMDAIGYPYEHLNATQIKQRLPIVDIHRYEPVKKIDDEKFAEPTGDEIFGAMYFPDSGYINDPQLATQNVKEAAMAVAAKFLFNTQVIEITQRDGRARGVKLVDGSQIVAPIVVNVAGPHSGKINALAGIGANTLIKTRPVRQEVASLKAPDGFDYENLGPFCADDDVGTYSRPETGNRMLIGTVSPPCDETDWVDADNFNTSISDQITTQIMRQAQRYSGLQIPSSVNGIVALYDVSDDWSPIYDKSDLPGYYMAIGTSGNQFKNAPLAGKIMTQIIEACQSGVDHDKTPGEIHLNEINWTLPLEKFSRNRKPNANSSFSVLG